MKEAKGNCRRRTGIIALVVSVALVAAACTADDADSTTTTAALTLAAPDITPTATPTPTTTTSPTTTAVPPTTTTSAALTLAEPDICAEPQGECPDFSQALPGDDGDGPLPLGTVDEVPNENRLDFLFRVCFDECFLDAHFLDPENPEFGAGTWTADKPFHIRNGFMNSSGEPLGEGFDLAVYVSRQPGYSDESHLDEADEAGFELGEVYKFTSEYVLQGSSDRCGPTFESQTSSEICEWFVHDFPDGLPLGRFTIWAIWEAPCSAWSDLGLPEICDDPDQVISKFSSTVNAPFGDDEPNYDATS